MSSSSTLNTSNLKKCELEVLANELHAKVEATKAEVAAMQEWKAKLSRNFKIGTTIILGCGIPLLSLSLSKIAGTLAFSCPALALFAFALMVAVLVVSLPHLQWSISDITKSDSLPSWALAIALDLTLVCCELVHTYAEKSGLGTLTVTLMIAVCAVSMALNVWAFFMHPHTPKKNATV
jgi:hypothetical protein